MNTTRFTAFFAAAAMTALLVGSQLGLASHYNDAGALQWAHQAAAQQVQASASTARTAG